MHEKLRGSVQAEVITKKEIAYTLHKLGAYFFSEIRQGKQPDKMLELFKGVQMIKAYLIELEEREDKQMGELCTDNRFEIIERYKKRMLEETNIETSPDEMKVIDSFLYRCWQMGWLDCVDAIARVRNATSMLLSDEGDSVIAKTNRGAGMLIASAIDGKEVPVEYVHENSEDMRCKEFVARKVRRKCCKKYVIELGEIPFVKRGDGDSPELWRVKGFNSLVFDQAGLDKLESLQQYEKSVSNEIDRVKAEAYNEGIIDAINTLKDMRREPK